MPTGEFEVAHLRKVLADRYRIERVIGEGGMATVFLAEDLKHHRQVAVKVMRPELVATLGSDRFLREVEIAAQLSHPHILPMYDSGTAESAGNTGALLYYVMPYVEGESLAGRIAREGALPVRDALRIALEVAGALGHAHKRGIVHRDIKPANILLSEGHALVADFGIARALDSSAEAITATGIAIGTPQYMSPEQATGEKGVDARTDLYALGAVLYEMLTGEPPFTGRTAQAVVSRTLTERPRPVGATREGLPAGLEELVAQALAKSPADRYATAAHLADALVTVESGSYRAPSGRTGAAGEESPGENLWAVFGGISLLALTSVAFLAGKWGLPGWVLGLAVALLVAGALMLGLTARAERRRRTGAAPGGLGVHLTWRNAALGGIAAVIAWAGTAALASARNPASREVAAASEGSTHVAVLPFQNQGDPADNYIVDGITDEVRGKLSRISGLAVIASGSSVQYRSSTLAPREIAEELGVKYLLVGRVRWAGTQGNARRLQVVSELVDGVTGSTEWQQTFDANVTDVFQVQSQIAALVAGALGTRIGAGERQELERRPTTIPAAWDEYLKGMAISALDPVGQRRAASHFEQAVAVDSAFAEAWGRLSIAMTRIYLNGARDPGVARRAKETFERALALDPVNPVGHTAAVMYYADVRRDADSAQQSLRAALQAAPNDPDVLAAAGRGDILAGRLESGIRRLEQARELDPRSIAILSNLHRSYLSVGNVEAAVEVAEASIGVAPTDPSVYQWLAISRVAAGDLAGARDGVRRGIANGVSPAAIAAYFAGFFEMSWVLDPGTEALVFRLTPAAFDGDRAWWGQSLATAHWVRGRRDLARAYADSALEASTEQTRAAPDDPAPLILYALVLAYAGRNEEAMAEGRRAVTMPDPALSPFGRTYDRLQLARIYIASGEAEQALDEIELVVGSNAYWTPGWLGIDPLFDSLRGNPRYQRLLRKGS